MNKNEMELAGWRRWAGLEVLAHLTRVHGSETGKRVLLAAIDKAYALIYNSPSEGGLALDIEILVRLAEGGGWNVGTHLTDARQVLQGGRKLDPVATLLFGLAEKVAATGAPNDFLAGVLATQSYYQGEPDALLLRLRVIAAPFSKELDLSILDGGPEESTLAAAGEAPPVESDPEPATQPTAEPTAPPVEPGAAGVPPGPAAELPQPAA